MALLDLDLVAVEVGSDESKDLKGGIGQLEDDIREDVVIAECDYTLQEGFELLEVLSGFISFVFLEFRLGLGEFVVVDCPEAIEHFLHYVEVALAVLGQ